MNSHFSKAFAVALGGFLASCASTPHSASGSASLQGRPQLADVQPSPTDAALRAGVPAAGACALIPEAEQNVCPLQRTVVLGTRELKAPIDTHGYVFAPVGAVVYMVAAPGLTQEWLGHLVECYEAKTAMAGNALQARESCPLAEPGSSYSVSSTGDGFAVSIRSSDHDAARRIIEVSERLAPSNSPHREALAVRP